MISHITSIARCWHHRIADPSTAEVLGDEQEQRSRLVKGFSAIELRGIEKSGTVPSSL